MYWRNRGLDILRAIAVVMVLFRHAGNTKSLMHKVGWLGVDLFFVLSGFIITSLLIESAKTDKPIDSGTFMWRRILKIVPPFYLFAVISILMIIWSDQKLPSGVQLLSEFLYLQTYFSRIWQHTWSLAVEAHFYLLICLLLHFIGCKALVYHRQQRILTLIILLVLSFLLRLEVSWPHRFEAFFDFMATHLRFDGILFGVLAAFLAKTRYVTQALKTKRIYLLPISFLLLLPSLYFEGGSFFMNTLGISLANAGFAIVTLLMYSWQSLNLSSSPNLVWAFPVEIGLASYSIYLWHLSARWLVMQVLPESSLLFDWCYIPAALLLGWLLYRLVEKPIMRHRDLIIATIKSIPALSRNTLKKLP